MSEEKRLERIGKRLDRLDTKVSKGLSSVTRGLSQLEHLEPRIQAILDFKKGLG